MAIYLFANNFATTLNGAIDSTQTTITLTSATGLPTIGAGQQLSLTVDDGTNIEEMTVTDDSSNPTFTVTRNADGLGSHAFADGTVVEMRPTSTQMSNLFQSLTDANGESLTGVTIADDDKVIIQDTDDSDSIKTITTKSIRDLTPTSGFTGTGAEVRESSPTLIAPTLGVASATSISLDGGTNKIELLETGVWKPELYGLTVAGSPTYTANAGRYAVYGTQNYEFWVLTLQLIWTSLGGAEGNMAISGSPVNPNGAVNRFGFFAVWWTGLSLTTYPPIAYMDNITNNIRLHRPTATQSTDAITHTQLTDTGTLYLNCTGIKPT